ncbi:Protein of unknown function [Pyronema omphalodes CBS 100304]|uniref:Uncharacterized protein n=1 Tax=Pyronema omphalodes (strain CBS 100304) TaxID=1076935 RepID=U4LCS6_PYROM|nr:Protein of unknown function [Pyronema omphalodes CBS 100304]
MWISTVGFVCSPAELRWKSWGCRRIRWCRRREEYRKNAPEKQTAIPSATVETQSSGWLEEL